MTRRPSFRSAAVARVPFVALTLLVLACRPRASARRTGSGRRQRVQRLALPPDELHPAGHRRPQVPRDHGHARRPLDAVRHPAAAAVVVRQLGRLRADLLPADRRAALLLLVHRRLHRQRLPLAVASRAGALRSDDHRLQPGRHVRRRSHPPRAADVSRRLHRHRRVQHPQGVRVVEGLRRDRQPDQPGARSHPRLRRRSRPRRDPPQRHRHAVREGRTPSRCI